VTILALEARTPQEMENTFSVMAQKKAGAVIVLRDSLFNQQVRELAALAVKYRMPSIHGVREYVETGGLMSYGSSLAYNFRRAATYVDKILKGVKPADLPIEQPTRFELILNLKTARALNLTVPPSLLARADRVVE
jgi:putative ABC transport system substrate-binding protein